jgi:hypothetical protein
MKERRFAFCRLRTFGCDASEDPVPLAPHINVRRRKAVSGFEPKDCRVAPKILCSPRLMQAQMDYGVKPPAISDRISIGFPTDIRTPKSPEFLLFQALKA